VAYGPNLLDMFRQIGVFVAKVLQGSKPSDLPIERPSKFELVVNIRTAKALSSQVGARLDGCLIHDHRV
jgi:putative ABC transport system substrate-binding protein